MLILIRDETPPPVDGVNTRLVKLLREVTHAGLKTAKTWAEASRSAWIVVKDVENPYRDPDVERFRALGVRVRYAEGTVDGDWAPTDVLKLSTEKR